jgi:hypothetical protein
LHPRVSKILKKILDALILLGCDEGEYQTKRSTI